MFDPDYVITTPAVRQTENWSCSACSWAWLANSIGQHYTEWEAIGKIGYPQNINRQDGLADGSGARLDDAYAEFPLQWPAHHAALTWEDAVKLAAAGPLLLGGHGFYHWVAVRGVANSVLWLANPSPNWFGVGDDLDYGEWQRFGPWSGVWLAEPESNVGPA